MSFTALIAGSSGMVGNSVLQLLLNDTAYENVISIGRREVDVEHSKLKQVIVDFEKLEEQADLFSADHIYCCLGTTIKKAKSREAFRKVDQVYPLKMAMLAAENNAMSFSIITAMGSDSRSSIFYNKVKGEVEDELAETSIPCVNIVQPSLLLGDREESRFGERLGQVAMKFTSGLMIGGLKKYKAIEGDQVARAMVSITKEQRKGFFKYPNDELMLF